jgi:hypothetical protein
MVLSSVLSVRLRVDDIPALTLPESAVKCTEYGLR